MDAAMMEMTVIAADDLKNVRKLGKRMRTYAVVCTDNGFNTSTRIDGEGGSCPVWKDKLQLSLPEGVARRRGYALTIRIFCKTTFGKKEVAWTKVPFSDIIEGYGAPDSLHCLSYRLRTRKGKPRGTIDLSVRLMQQAVNRPQFFNYPNSKSPQQGAYNPVTPQFFDYPNSKSPQQGANYPLTPQFQLHGEQTFPIGSKANVNYSYPPSQFIYPPPHHQQI